MKMRKLKWKKLDKLEYYNDCVWSSYDKNSNIKFFIIYWVEDIVGGKFYVDISSHFNDEYDEYPIFSEECKTTKWDIKRFEKYELEPFKSYLINKTIEKLQEVITKLKNIKTIQ